MSSPLGGLPSPPMTVQSDVYRFSPEWAGWFNTAQSILRATSSSGLTSGRPTSGQFSGMPYFDTTLGIPIWLLTPGGSPVWVNAVGAPV